MSVTWHSVTLPPSCSLRLGACVFCASMQAAKKISVWAPEVILSVSSISREKTTAISSFQEYSLILRCLVFVSMDDAALASAHQLTIGCV